MSWDLRYRQEYLRRLRNQLSDLGLLENGELIWNIITEIERNIGEYSN